MNNEIIRKLDMLKRLVRFLLDHAVAPALARLTAAQAVVTATITALDTAGERQLSGAGQFHGGIDLRETTARALRDYLKDICRTGRSLDDLYPGLRATFYLPQSGSYPALLVGARSIIAAATPIQQSFQDAGLPATFLTEVGALLSEFETATSQKYGGLTSQVMGTAALKAKVNLGVIAAKRIDAIVRNVYRGNAEMLAAWSTARHIERAPRKKKETGDQSTMPPATPTNGTGTGGATTNTTTVPAN